MPEDPEDPEVEPDGGILYYLPEEDLYFVPEDEPKTGGGLIAKPEDDPQIDEELIFPLDEPKTGGGLIVNPEDEPETGGEPDDECKDSRDDDQCAKDNYQDPDATCESYYSMGYCEDPKMQGCCPVSCGVCEGDDPKTGGGLILEEPEEPKTGGGLIDEDP
jgi:hypothetical protein